MNVFIFAIGGTGARVLRSLTFCLAAGMEKIPDGTTIVPLIIDYDKTNGDKERTIKLLETYEAIRDDAYDGVVRPADERNFFHPQIKHLSEIATLAGKKEVGIEPSFEFKFGLDDKADVGTFAKHIDYQHMKGATYLTKDLLSTLYNDEKEGNTFSELNLELSKGFKGNPNIGSIIFENIKDDAEFQKFTTTFDPAKDRVFIISSIFGGTGSSGFPRIVDAIHYSGIAGFNDALVGACVVMPYFRVNTPKGGAIYSNIFNSKQKAALSYYAQKDQNGKSLYDKLATTYFIGEDEPTTLPYSEGEATQMNDAHIVEFLSALSILDFISGDARDLRRTKYREFGLPVKPGPDEKITFRNFDKDDYEDYMSYLFTMGITFKYYRDYVANGTIPSKKAYYAGLGLSSKVGHEEMFKKLEKFIGDWSEWLDEMAGQKDGFKPFLNKSRSDDSHDPVAEDLYDYVVGYEAPEGGLFSKGATYEDFTSFCNSAYKQIKNDWANEDQIFLETLYEASQSMYELYEETNDKK